MNRVSQWTALPIAEWRTAVNGDLDRFEARFADTDDDIAAGLQAVRLELSEVKEQQKWILRTMWGLLVGLLMVFAGIVATIVVP